MGPTWGTPGPCRPQMAPCWPHEPCYQGWFPVEQSVLSGVSRLDTQFFTSRSKKSRALFNIKPIYPDIGILIIRIKRSLDCLIFIMRIPMLVQWHFYIETALRCLLRIWNLLLSSLNCMPYHVDLCLTLRKFDLYKEWSNIYRAICSTIIQRYIWHSPVLVYWQCTAK